MLPHSRRFCRRNFLPSYRPPFFRLLLERSQIFFMIFHHRIHITLVLISTRPVSFSAGHPTFLPWQSPSTLRSPCCGPSPSALQSFLLRYRSRSFSATRPIATSIIPPLAASLMKALSAELNLRLAFSLVTAAIRTFDLGCFDFQPKAVPLRPNAGNGNYDQSTNRIFMGN